jgi:hypothetical protein
MISGDMVDVAFGSTYTYVAFLNHGVYLWDHGGYDWASLTNFALDAWSVRVPSGALPAGSKITRLQLRSDGRLWVATDQGLFYFDVDFFVGKIAEIPVYTGIGPGIISRGVQDILLDHEENLWVATNLGLNRIDRDDPNDIQAFTTPAVFVALSGLRYPLDIVSPLANADCKALALHRTSDILYIGTFGGLSVYDFSAPPPTPTDLSRVYVYPNPVLGSRGHDALRIANLTGPVTVEIYDLEGELVDSRRAEADGDVVWDLLTRDGFPSGSGKYIVRVIGPTGSVQLPIAVLR